MKGQCGVAQGVDVTAATLCAPGRWKVRGDKAAFTGVSQSSIHGGMIRFGRKQPAVTPIVMCVILNVYQT